MASRVRDTLVVGRVIGDVLDEFSRSIFLRVTYNDRELTSGCEFRPSQVVNQPRVDIGGEDIQTFFTLVMLDPDAPSPSNPNLRTGPTLYRKLVTDIPGTTGVNFGQELVCYKSPRPSMGIHRLVFVLFRQLGRQTVFAPEWRQNFNTREFAVLYNLGSPVSAVYFNCQREAGSGVIWKGDSLIDGVPETLDMLRSKGKRLVFVTNNSTKSRKQYGKKFETLGLSVNEEEIFASSFAASAYLKSINFPKDKKVYVIGEEGILKELELAGFQYLGGPEDGGKKIELKPGFLMEHDENVGAVVVGFDRHFNYYKVQYGTLCIRENPGCLFIATNRDAVTHLTDAQEWAGGGSMVGALWGSTQKEPLVVGKPSSFMMDYLADEFGITKTQICMVGDRLDTGILFGQNGGCKTLLVLSGVTSLSMLQNPKNSIQPDFYTSKISDFLSLKAATV